MEYKYDAFISYRHRERDMAVAKKLQKLLESLKKKDGSKLRIFLDTTELSCATSVEGALRKELEQSRYLIVICSPDYKDPKKKDKKKRDYCKEELNYFLQLRGNNNNILTVLVEGEPDDSFPDELLQYREETGLDQSGNPVKVRVEMDPLAADVRGGALNDQLKKLKVEYLQIAAPLLDVEFDQLYQREHRRELRKRSVMIAGLLALLIYSLIMIFQISQRQRLLEAKQQELYQNESIRLANEAMLLMEEDPGLARMLAHTALPANLQEPDYPVTQEAEISIRTAALQHMYAEAAAPFTPIARVAFSNTHWGFGVICGDGNYFSVVDSVQTRVYESRTGRLIGVFPSREVFFFEGADRCVYESSRMLENGEWWSGYSVCDLWTGEELWRIDAYVTPDMDVQEGDPVFEYLEYEKETGRLWVVLSGYTDPLGPPPADPTYLEIRNGRLLALDSERTEFRIYSLEDVDRDPRRIQPSSHGAEIRLSSNRRILTADGLLIIPGSRSSFYADRTDTVSEIFDTETCKKIDFYSFYTEDDQDYYYDAVGGYLILQYMDEFYIQRRGASGDFEVVYVIVSQHDNMIIDGSSSICDGTWLVLQSEEFCEIYRLEDGTLCYSFRKLDGRDCQIGVIDGQLYDFCMGWNRVSIPLLDTEEASMYIRDVLSRDGFRRILTDQEMQEYYVPSHWREKA